MADFIPKVQSEPVAGEEPADTKVKVGEKQYSQTDLERLVGLGEKTEEVQTKYNTKLDRVYPEYTKSTQKVKEYEGKLAEAEAKLKELQAKAAQTGQAWTPEQKELAKKELQELLGGEPMTEARFDKKYTERRAGEKLLEECEGYADEIDGSDGRPKFATEEILTHMRETGFRDPLKAYKDKYEKELDEWKTKQIGAAKKPGLVTQTQTTANKQPQRVKITDENLREAIKDELYGVGR